MRIRVVTAVLLAATLWAAPAVAEASFNQQATSAQSVTSAMLQPPTNFTFSRSACTVTLSWTPTSDVRATGYRVFNGAALLTTLSPKTLNSYRFTANKGANYSLTMLTYHLNWTSGTTPVVAFKC
jgi:hypothetical protein